MTRFPDVPTVSKSQINRAGHILVDSNSTADQIEDARQVVDQWRACHGYPINTFQSTLRSKVRNFHNTIVAQRLKRLPTIVDKLKRYPEMELSRMQDVGGVRVVVGSMAEVRKIELEYRDKSRFDHELTRSDDYIERPRGEDGYRSVHLVYKYRNTLPQAKQYNGLRLELQIRTRTQHNWATAVETMGTLLGQALKARQGDREWLDFFAQTSSAFAHIEGTPPVPRFASMSKKDTFKAVSKAEKKLSALEKLEGLTIAADAIYTSRNPAWYYHLLILNSTHHSVEIRSFGRDDLEKASEEYSAAEKRAAQGETIEPVLVSAGNLHSLKLAYPNYFLDAKEFANRVRRIVTSNRAD